MEMKSCDAIRSIDRLSIVGPVDDRGDTISKILDNNWYNRPNNNESYNDDDQIDSEYSEARMDMVSLEEVYERTDEHRDKSWYEYHEYERLDSIEYVSEGEYKYEYKDFFDPEVEFWGHAWQS